MNDRARMALAFLIILVILFVWTVYFSPKKEPSTPSEKVVVDTVVQKTSQVLPVQFPQKEDTIVVDRKNIRVVLSSIGGSIKALYLKAYDVNLVPEGGYLFLTKSKDDTLVKNFNYIQDYDSVVFMSEGLRKVYRFDQDFGFHLSCDSSDQVLSLRSGLSITEVKNRGEDLRNFAVYIKTTKIENITKKIKDQYRYRGKFEWFALRSKYFLLVVNNLDGIGEVDFYKLSKEESIKGAGFGCYYMRGGGNRYGSEIVTQGPINISVLSLAVRYDELKKYHRGYEEIASGGIWGPIARIILLVMNFFFAIFKNYGVAIIIFAILIKLIFFPLSRQMIISQHKMQMLQPELKKIQKKYKDDPQRLNQEMMHLYKAYKVNPFSGCLPLLIQMPIFFALFRTLTIAIEFRQASFMFWITDLSMKDPYYILPIGMGIMMLIQSLTTNIDPRQKFMVIFMPIFMVFIFLNLPSGLQLYWFTYNILTLIEHYITKRGGIK
ncbi:hypothetical protein BXT86_03895 [candidate division WOR-3 bacterium 4484_100]|uniref:Membrane protein insertase YidC n=1 Tax=candidate division WOR-3 bacterium 4484_100 TaxID=1936077 RepID=A0A1V4QGS9_UNCW3|nr:MAG: hypothetical protein BXT86_03895 [candidate division WOR-3 bacterium 4484_100]